MAKKKFLTINNIIYLASIVLAVVAICMIFVTSMSYTVTVLTASTTTSYTGVQVTFGYSSENLEYLVFSFMNLLPYLLVVVAVVLLVLKLFGVVNSKIIDWIIVALFVVAGILFFCVISFAQFGEYFTSLSDLEWDLGAGAIVSGVLSLVSAVAVAAGCLIPSKSKK